MGILGNAIDTFVGKAIGLGFGQIDDLITRKIQEGKLEEAAQLAQQADEEFVRKEGDLFNLYNPPDLPGVGGLLGEGAVTRGQPDLSNPDVQAQIAAARQVPEEYFQLGAKGDTGILGQGAFNKLQQFQSNDPFYANQKFLQDQRKKVSDTIIGTEGKYAEQHVGGINEIGNTVRGVPPLTRQDVLNRREDRRRSDKEIDYEYTQKNRDDADARRKKNKTPKEKKPNKINQTTVNGIKKLFLEDPNFIVINPSTNKPELTPAGKKTYAQAIKTYRDLETPDIYQAYEMEAGKTLDSVRRDAPLPLGQGGGQASEPPTTTGTDPIAKDIQDARNSGMTDTQIKALLKKDGIDPTKYGL